jgi:hypothetical protein
VTVNRMRRLETFSQMARWPPMMVNSFAELGLLSWQALAKTGIPQSAKRAMRVRPKGREPV